MTRFRCARVEGSQHTVLPGRSRLTSYIWKKSAPYNHVQDNRSLNKAVLLDLSLRKWELDPVWAQNPQNTLWFRMGINRRPNGRLSITLQYDQEPIHNVDKRAMCRMIYWWSGYIEGNIILDRISYSSRTKFKDDFSGLINSSFAIHQTSEYE